MPTIRHPRLALAVSMAVLSAGLAAVLLRPGAAVAQRSGLAAVQPCECAAAVQPPGLNVQVANCSCGGTTCVVAETKAANQPAVLQCVR